MKRLYSILTKLKLWQIALLFSVISGFILLNLAWKDSITADEGIHFTAGYSYVILGDYRFNPEHPPLLKLLSGTSIFIFETIFNKNLIFDQESIYWKDVLKGQFGMSHTFLSANKDLIYNITFFARLPSIILFLVFGTYSMYFIFYYTKNKLFSVYIGILTFFSINLLAHSYLVTTDMIVVLSFLFIIDRFIRYLNNPDFKKLILLDLSLILGFLSKFSIIIILPILLIIYLIYFKNVYKNISFWKKTLIHFVISVIFIFIGISLIYFISMRNMPLDIQRTLLENNLTSENILFKLLKTISLILLESPLTKYLSQYLLGLGMVFNRVSSGNETFLLGNLTKESFPLYFPLSYILKESVLFLTLFLGTILFEIYNLFGYKKRYYKKYSYLEISIALFILLYWIISIKGNLNLGIRHILPIVGLSYILIILRLSKIVKNSKYILCLNIIFFFYFINTIIIYPNYISYMNPLSKIYGEEYQIFVDSNLDWRQDLKRLKIWIDVNNIEEIYIDYFGGDNIYYYFDHNDTRIKPYLVSNGELRNTYLAVSATQYQLRYKNTLNYHNQEYGLLAQKKPIKIIGSILIFKID